MARDRGPETVDLTAHSMPTGSLRPEDLLLERYTREVEQLGKQANPMSELAKNLDQAAQSVRAFTKEMDKLPEIAKTLGVALREAFVGAIEAARSAGAGGVGGRGNAPGAPGATPITSPLLIGAVTGAVISAFAKEIHIPTAQAIPAPLATRLPTNLPVAGLLRPGVDYPAPRSINEFTDKDFLDLPGVGPKKLKDIKEAQTKGPFAGVEDFLERSGVTKNYHAEIKSALEGGKDTQGLDFLRTSMKESLARQVHGMSQTLVEIQAYGSLLVDALKQSGRGQSGDAGFAQFARRQREIQETERLNRARSVQIEGRADIRALEGEGGGRALSIRASREEFKARAVSAQQKIGRMDLGEELRTDPQRLKAMNLEQQEAAQQQTISLRDQVEQARLKTKWMSSPEGRNSLREESKLNRELATQGRSQHIQQLIADYGRVGGRVAYVNELLVHQGITLDRISQFGSRAAVGITAGIMGVVSQGDPVAYQTFKESLRGLSMVVGEQFGPVVLQVAGHIQRLTASIEQLDPETKQSIVRWTGYGLALSGVAIVLPRVIGMLQLMGRIVTLGSVTGAWATGIVGLTTAVMALGAAWIYTEQQAARARFEMQMRGTSIGRPQVSVQDTSEAMRHLRDLPAGPRGRIETAGRDPEAVRIAVAEESARTERELAAARARLAAATGTSADQTEREVRVAGELLPRVTRAMRSVPELWQDPEADTPEGMRAAYAIRERRRQEFINRFVTVEMGRGGVPLTDADTRANIVQRLVRGIGGHGVREPVEPPEVRRANAELERIRNEQSILGRITGLLGGAETKLSLKNLLPQPQMFRDFAQFGEQIQIRALEAQGQQDVINELRHINAILKYIQGIGTNIEAATDPAKAMAGFMQFHNLGPWRGD